MDAMNTSQWDEARKNIKHVVMICMENRSYNHIFGAYEKELPDDQTINNLNVDMPVATPHTFAAGSSCRFFKTWNGDLSTIGFRLSSMIDDYSSREFHPWSAYDILSKSFKKGSLPALHYLYENYTACSRWFHAVPGPTYPNKMFLYSGTSKGKIDNDDITNNINDNNQQTLLSLLEDNGKKWRVYYGSSSDFRFFEKHADTTKSETGKFRDISQFYNDIKVATNDTFPEFCVVEANYETRDGYTENDYHPDGGLPINSERFISDVYNALISNEDIWSNTLLILTFDEWGGFYDHFAPIQVIPPEENTSFFQFDFKTSGFRVPTLLISPWTKQCKQDSTIYEHTSMIAFVIKLFQLNGVNMGNRVANAIPISINNFDFNKITN